MQEAITPEGILPWKKDTFIHAFKKKTAALLCLLVTCTEGKVCCRTAQNVTLHYRITRLTSTKKPVRNRQAQAVKQSITGS